ncbi:MAG TPA: DAK2 domain-containing protein [Rubrobacteraceae bacterium]|nr:DAK2 domain-containing protein [Rubrobacteraceae bacterium]
MKRGTAEKREAAGANDAGPHTTDLEAVVAAAHAALKANAAKIDALNVYPVPDGDTGTNMLLTIKSVLEGVSGSPGLTGEAAAKVVSRAALMGARGNSGVILSQILRGACETLGKVRALDAETFAAALACAKERAYSAVREPVEGTMLSVIADAAAAARACVDRGEKNPLEVLKAAAREAHASVRRTPELLGVLREAGVVDAGGLGVAVILDGLRAALSGARAAQDLEEDDETAPDEGRLRSTVEHSAEEAWGYCTEFLVNGFSGDEGEFGARIGEFGKSVLVIPDDDLVKVHLHTQDPGEALSYAAGFGRLSGVKIDDMEAQTRARSEGQRFAERTPVNVGVVAASRGEGNRRLYESMGAVIVEGGQGANPSAEDFVRAVEEAGAGAVILLPNNKNVVATAERVGELAYAEVYVVPTTSIAGGLAAMVGYDPEGEPEEVAEEMREISSSLRSAEVTRAVRDARVEGREVQKGSYIGLLDGKLEVVEDTTHATTRKLAEKMLENGADILTLLWGADLDEKEAGQIADAIRDLDPDLEVEVRHGGQPLYPVQMVVE